METALPVAMVTAGVVKSAETELLMIITSRQN